MAQGWCGGAQFSRLKTFLFPLSVALGCNYLPTSLQGLNSSLDTHDAEMFADNVGAWAPRRPARQVKQLSIPSASRGGEDGVGPEWEPVEGKGLRQSSTIMSSSTLQKSLILKMIKNNTFSLVFEMLRGLSAPFPCHGLTPSGEVGRADVGCTVLQWGARRCGEAEDPGVSGTVAELDLDLWPLPPGLGAFVGHDSGELL